VTLGHNAGQVSHGPHLSAGRRWLGWRL